MTPSILTDPQQLTIRTREYATTKHPKLPPLLQLFGGSFSHGPHTIVGMCPHLLIMISLSPNFSIIKVSFFH
jgi:hypothetical protein